MQTNLLAKRLKELRKAHGYTQDYVADFLGLVRQTYSHYETGKRSPSPEILFKLSGLYSISVDDLMHLKRGGRLSATSAVMGTLIGVKPILHMSDEGKLEAIAKVRGKHNAINEVAGMVLEKKDETTDIVHVFHVGAPDTADAVAEKLRAGGINKVHIYQLGPCISAHVGAGGFGAIFHSKK